MTPATRVPSLLALTLVVTLGRPAAAALVPVVPPPGQHPDPPLQKQR